MLLNAGTSKYRLRIQILGGEHQEKHSLRIESSSNPRKLNSFCLFRTYRGAHDNARFYILVRLWRYGPLELAKLGSLINSVEWLIGLDIARKR